MVVQEIAECDADLIRRNNIKIKKPTPSPSPSMDGNVFTDDILLEIFIRLHDNLSVVRSGSVCKRWYFLIHNSVFIQRFMIGHHGSHTLLFQRVNIFISEKKWYFDSKLSQLVTPNSNIMYESPTWGYMDFLACDLKRVIKGSISPALKDLLLVKVRENLMANWCFCNPITKQCLVLPNNMIRYRDMYRYGVVIMCPITNRITIFSFGSGKWRISDISFPMIKDNNEHFGWYPVACDGLLYWLDGYERLHGIIVFDPLQDGDDEDVDVDGDVGAKWCRIIDLPRDFVDATWQRSVDGICLGVCLGCLRFSQLLKRKAGHYALTVWELFNQNNDYYQWYLVQKVALEKESTNKMSVIAFHPINEDVIFLLCDNQFFRYEIGKRNFEEVGQWPNDIINTQKWGSQESLYSFQHPSWPTPIPPPPSI